MRALLGVVAVASLAACAPEIPDSSIGFDNSADAQRARELELTGGGGTLIPPPVVSDERLPPAEPFTVSPAPQTAGSSSSASSADIAAETAACRPSMRARRTRPQWFRTIPEFPTKMILARCPRNVQLQGMRRGLRKTASNIRWFSRQRCPAGVVVPTPIS